MALIKCPECGSVISSVADSCPKCGYPINKNSIGKKHTKKSGCFSSCLEFFLVSIIALVIVFVGTSILFELDNDKQENKIENYNDNSRYHQILAKNYFEGYIKENLKDPDSFERVSWSSEYNRLNKCYEVSITFRANNSFGAKIVETWKSDVEMDDKSARFLNIRKSY